MIDILYAELMTLLISKTIHNSLIHIALNSWIFSVFLLAKMRTFKNDDRLNVLFKNLT